MLDSVETVTYPSLKRVVKYQYFDNPALDAAFLPPTPPPFYSRNKFAEFLWCRFFDHAWIIHSKDWNTKNPARAACCVNCGLIRIEIFQIA